FDDGLMEREVRVDVAAMVAGAGGRAHLVDQLREPDQRLVVDARRRLAGGKALERGADRIAFEQVVGRDLPDVRAAERRADDESKELEVAKGLTDGRLTDAELLRDPGLDD